MRTAWRLLITHRRLLEWNPSSDPDRNGRTDLAGSCRTMWIAPVIAVAAAITLALLRPTALVVSLPHSGSLVYLPRYRLVDQPATRPPRSKADD